MGRKKNTDNEAGTSAVCPNGHLVIRHTADGDFECDACSADISTGALYFGCGPCDYSLCSGCYIKKATGELVEEPKLNPEDANRMDPDVLDLCDHFNIEERVMYKLNEVMKTRQNTFASDMEKLWEELTNARSPAGLLMAKVRQMMDGTFVGNTDNVELKRVITKYRLDHDAKTKLTGFLSQRQSTMENDLQEIEKRLATSNNPSATVMMCMVKLHKGEKLPEVRNVVPHREYGELNKGSGAKGGGRSDKPDRDYNKDNPWERERRENAARASDRERERPAHGYQDVRELRDVRDVRERDRPREYHSDYRDRDRDRDRYSGRDNDRDRDRGSYGRSDQGYQDRARDSDRRRGYESQDRRRSRSR